MGVPGSVSVGARCSANAYAGTLSSLKLKPDAAERSYYSVEVLNPAVHQHHFLSKETWKRHQSGCSTNKYKPEPLRITYQQTFPPEVAAAFMLK